MRSTLMIALACLVLSNGEAVAAATGADETTTDPPAFSGPQARAVHERLQAVQPELPVARVERAPIEGLYEVWLTDGAVMYVGAQARYLITGRGFRNAGDLHAVRGDAIVNLSEQRAADRRAEKLAAVDTQDAIVFSPEGEVKSTLYVFTDVDCPFCQRMHKEIDAINALGIEVRYLGYPREGLGSSTARRMANAWCAKDPQRALTRLKQGKPIPKVSCESPIAAQYRLGQAVGVRGTPAVFTADGKYIGGYLPPDALAEASGIASAAKR